MGIDSTDPRILVSPAEPAILRAPFLTSSFPEHVGADFLCSTHHGLAGIQRKEFPGDFLSSLRDGRLQREIPQMSNSLTHRLLLLEGRGKWTTSGALVDKHHNYTMAQHQGILLSLQFEHGISYLQIDSQAETLPTILRFFSWAQKPHHGSLSTRPGPGSSPGYMAGEKAWRLHFLQGLPGVGVELADRILSHFGRVPFGPPKESELVAVDGIGKTKARRILGMFQ